MDRFLCYILIFSLTLFPYNAQADGSLGFTSSENKSLPEKTNLGSYTEKSNPYSDWLIKRALSVRLDLDQCLKEYIKYKDDLSDKGRRELSWVFVKTRKKLDYLSFLERKFIEQSGITFYNAGYNYGLDSLKEDFSELKDRSRHLPNKRTVGSDTLSNKEPDFEKEDDFELEEDDFGLKLLESEDESDIEKEKESKKSVEQNPDLISNGKENSGIIGTILAYFEKLKNSIFDMISLEKSEKIGHTEKNPLPQKTKSNATSSAKGKKIDGGNYGLNQVKEKKENQDLKIKIKNCQKDLDKTKKENQRIKRDLKKVKNKNQKLDNKKSPEIAVSSKKGGDKKPSDSVKNLEVVSENDNSIKEDSFVYEIPRTAPLEPYKPIEGLKTEFEKLKEKELELTNYENKIKMMETALIKEREEIEKLKSEERLRQEALAKEKEAEELRINKEKADKEKEEKITKLVSKEKELSIERIEKLKIESKNSRKELKLTISELDKLGDKVTRVKQKSVEDKNESVKIITPHEKKESPILDQDDKIKKRILEDGELQEANGPSY